VSNLTLSDLECFLLHYMGNSSLRSEPFRLQPYSALTDEYKIAIDRLLDLGLIDASLDRQRYVRSRKGYEYAVEHWEQLLRGARMIELANEIEATKREIEESKRRRSA
jgi:hypothetical protein